jgi:hypothetical protein
MDRIEVVESALYIVKHLRPDHGGALRRDDARNLLRRTMETYVRRHGLRVHAWAFLPSRVEMVIGLPTAVPLQESLGDLFGYFTRRFNARYRRNGAVMRTKFVRRLLVGPASIHGGIVRVNAAAAADDLVNEPGREPWSSVDSLHGGTSDRIVTRYVPGDPSLRAGLVLRAATPLGSA